MLKRPTILCASLLFVALLVLGVMRLFELRFDRGDIYPPYSTLRTDPLGTSVLYEGLERIPGVTPARYFDETFKNDEGHEHALFLLGTEPGSMNYLSRTEYDTLQRFVFNGGRVVIAYYPVMNGGGCLEYTNEMDGAGSGLKKSRRTHKKAPSKADGSEGETNRTGNADNAVLTNVIPSTNSLPVIKSKTSGEPAKLRHGRNSRRPEKSPDDGDEMDAENERLKYADLGEEWGFSFRYIDLATNEDGMTDFPPARLVAGKLELPPHLSIHTSLCFTSLTNGWADIYQRDEKAPVVMERKFGAGSVVLVADSYPFSNEAMFKDRSASLIAWMLGDGHEAIFDEAHLGIVEQPGVATLMRRYQLHGLIFSLLVVAGLFVWKNSISLVPPHDEGRGEAGLVVAGRDSASGFVNLVRRGIVPAEIINVCFVEWKKSGARAAAISPAQRRDVEQLIQQQAALGPHQRKPLENYRVLSQILKRRN